MTKKNNNCPVPTGVLVVIGGSENKGDDKPKHREAPEDFEQLEILKTVVALTKKQKPVVEVITTASSVGDESFQDYKEVFETLGIEQVGHIHHNSRQQVLNDNLEERIKNAHVLFFAGGDQLRLTSVYGGTGLLTYMKERYIHEGLIIAGTSAGAMAMSTPMIYAGNKEVEEITGEIKVTTGLQFLKDVCIDTHFVERGRFVRMAQVIVTNPTCIGVGIGEDTALIVRNGLEVEVIGSGLIIIIDGFNIGESNIDEFVKGKPVTIRDLKVHILSSGDTYSIPQVNPPHV